LPSDLIILIDFVGKKHAVILSCRALGAAFAIERRHCNAAFEELSALLYRSIFIVH